MAEFREVREEINADTAFVDRFSENGYLFLRDLDTAEYALWNVPRVVGWFRRGRGWLALDPGDTTICYRSCEVGGFLANACIHSAPMRHSYKSGVRMIDSLDLGSGWYAHVTTCRGCDE